MEIEEESLDDLLKVAVERVMKEGREVTATKGTNKEICCALLRLSNPRARLSHSETKGKVISAVGEFAWYMSASNDVNQLLYYLPDYRQFAEPDDTVHGAYGPRLFSDQWCNQFENVARLLKARSSSRKAVIQLFDRSDLLRDYKDVPCTCTLQFMVRDDRLNAVATMRSNDVFIGLPHDVFAFTMLQEVLARYIGVELGTYSHFAASLHLYDTNYEGATQLVGEGWLNNVAMDMPPMPAGNPKDDLDWFLVAEKSLRQGEDFDVLNPAIDPYWKDLAILLKAYKYHKSKEPEKISALRQSLTNNVYKEFVLTRELSAKRQ